MPFVASCDLIVVCCLLFCGRLSVVCCLLLAGSCLSCVVFVGCSLSVVCCLLFVESVLWFVVRCVLIVVPCSLRVVR